MLKRSITRRQLLKAGAITGAATVLPWKIALREAYAAYGLNSPNLEKFIQPLRSIGGAAGVFIPSNGDRQLAIPVAVSDGTSKHGQTIATHYTIDINQFFDQLHPNLGFTTINGYNPAGNAPQRHLGGVIAAFKNQPVQITFRNKLPPSSIIPVDTTLPGANQAQNRTAVHLHGGFVPWISDGGPHDWWAPDGTHGLSFLNNAVLNPGAKKNEAEYYYPNQQSARLLWYHDHAWGITRTNAYSGIATAYPIIGPEEDFVGAQGVPGPLDAKTFYLVFQDKIFKSDGSLVYADIYDFNFFGPPGTPSFGQTLLTPPPVPSCLPEFFGDTILVNGTVYPYMEVEQRRYRFRMLDACNARFLNPRLVFAKSNVIGSVDSTEPNPNALGPSFLQIGNEAGFLPAPVLADGKAFKVLIAPAERADLIVDFSNVPAGSVLILYNDAPGPFPGGTNVFDSNPLNPKTPLSKPGFGPNTRTLLQIRVKPSAPDPALVNLTLPPLDPPALVTQTPGVPIVPVIDRTNMMASVPGGPQGVGFRSLTLNEGFDEFGRLQQFIGTNVKLPNAVPGFFGRPYMETPTETPTAGSIEVWEIANLTGDTHPIHFHLVNVQILARQPFNAKAYAGVPTLSNQPLPPDLNELGYKETVRMNPGEVIWVVMQFNLPNVPFKVPASPRTGGNEYVVHCHILEHEEHDMMRPLVVF